MSTPSNRFLRSNLVLLMNLQDKTFADIDREYIRETSMVSGRHLRTIVGGEGRNCTLQTLDHMAKLFKVRPQDMISENANDLEERKDWADPVLENLIKEYRNATNAGKELIRSTAAMVPKIEKNKV